MPINFNAPGAVGNAPYGNERTNAQGSPYLAASPTAMNAFSTSDLERAIFDTIFDTKPGNYFDSLKVLAFGKAPVSVPDDVYSWDESPMQRVFILVDDGASATGTVLTALQTAVANGYRTATIPVTAGQMGRVGINHNVMFTGGAQGVVTGKGATSITVTSLVSEGLPAIVQGAKLPTMGETVGDSTIGWKNTERGTKIQRTNYVATFRRAITYGRKEAAKLRLNSRNNNVEQDHKNLLYELKIDAMQNAWYGRKGVRLLNDGNYAKGMDGVYTQMKNAGSVFAGTTAANLVATFKANCVSSNQQSIGGTRKVYAHSKWLLYLSEEFKTSATRYKNTDSMANLDLERIHIAGQNYDLIPVDAFADPSLFTQDCADRMFILDDSTIDPIKWSAFPMFDVGRIMAGQQSNYEDLPQNIQDNIQRQDFTVRDAELNFSIRMIEPRKSICLEITA
jgi:hypothetical protein